MFRGLSFPSAGKSYTPSDIAGVRAKGAASLALVKRKAAEGQERIERAAVDMQLGFRLRERGKISNAQALMLGRSYENTIKVYDRQFDDAKRDAISNTRTAARVKRIPLDLIPELDLIRALAAPWEKS